MKKHIPNTIFEDLGDRIDPRLKIVYLVLLLESDQAGVLRWTKELRTKLSTMSGMNIERSSFGALYPLREFITLTTDEKIILKDAIRYQYGKELKPGYNPHKPAFSLIQSYGFKYSKELNQVICLKKKI